MSLSELKFPEEEMAAQSVTALADRPELSAAELKERLDSGDIRVKINAVLDDLETERTLKSLRLLNRLVVVEDTSISSVTRIMPGIEAGEPLVAFILSTGRIFFGTPEELLEASMTNTL